MADHPLLRSFLFAPGSDEQKVKKATRSGADAVVLDLEDSVRPEDKAGARDSVGRRIHALASESSAEIHVRINRAGASYDPDDIAAVVVPGLSALRLPKCESASDVRDVEEMLDALEPGSGGVRLYPTIESAAGVLAAHDIARSSPRVAALVFGAADFGASIGVMAPPFEATLVARSTLVLASAASRVGPPIDGAYLDLADIDGLRAHSRRVKELGFLGKSAIHPNQLPVIHDVFTPSSDEIERARRILDGVSAGATTGVVDGRFVDPPVIAQARAVLELLRRIESKGV
ncbi:MAG TPA: CoA ester lyase [Acidimicrobiia bacterium]|nr:CoA ester lyase [Acidimicrobiia bacterium]